MTLPVSVISTGTVGNRGGSCRKPLGRDEGRLKKLLEGDFQKVTPS